jgi:hypothetical protein
LSERHSVTSFTFLKAAPRKSYNQQNKMSYRNKDLF